METFLDDLAEYLSDNGIGTIEEDLFLNKLIDSPDNQVAISLGSGAQPSTYVEIARPTVQVLVRNTDSDDGWDKMLAIFSLLHQKYDTINMGDTDVMKIDALQEPSPLGQDESERYIFTCNFLFWVRR